MPKFSFYFTSGNHFKTVGFFIQLPVTTQTGAVYRPNRSANRWKPVELSFFVWNLNLAGFFGNRSNRSGLPESEGGGFVTPVGKKNPGHEWIPHFHSVHSPQRHLPEKRRTNSDKKHSFWSTTLPEFKQICSSLTSDLNSTNLAIKMKHGNTVLRPSIVNEAVCTV